MNREIYIWCKDHGYRELLGVIYTRFESTFSDAGVAIRRESKPFSLGKAGDIVMIRIALDERYLAMANHQILNGLNNQGLREIGISLPQAA